MRRTTRSPQMVSCPGALTTSLVLALGLGAGGAIAPACTSSEAFLPPTLPGADAGAGGSAPVGSGGAASATGGASPAGSGGAVVPVAGSGGRPGTGGASDSSGSGGRAGATASGGAAGTVAGPPGSPGAVLLSDDFEDGSTKGWLQDPSDAEGKWAVTTDAGGSKVLTESVATSAISWMVGGNSTWTNQRVEAKVRFTSFTDSGATAYIATRFVDFDNYYFVQMKVDGSLKIRKRIQGSTSDLVTYKTKMALAAGDVHVFGMAFADSTLTIYLDGVAVATGPEASVSNPRGGIALGTQKLAADFDDVKVTVP